LKVGVPPKWDGCKSHTTQLHPSFPSPLARKWEGTNCRHDKARIGNVSSVMQHTTINLTLLVPVAQRDSLLAVPKLVAVVEK
jgi:hypothetical protein